MAISYSSLSSSLQRYSATYTGTTNWTAPNNTNAVKVLCVGGGGGGGSMSNGANATSIMRWATPGSGGQVVEAVVSVTPGTTYAVTVGAGGSGGTSTGNNSTSYGTNANSGAAGGDSSFGNLVLAYGGCGGGGVADQNFTNAQNFRWGHTPPANYTSNQSYYTSPLSTGYGVPKVVGNINRFGTTTYQSWNTPAKSYSTNNALGNASWWAGVGISIDAAYSNAPAQGTHLLYSAEGYGPAGYGAGSYVSNQANNGATNVAPPSYGGSETITPTTFGPGSGGPGVGYASSGFVFATYGVAGKNGFIRLEYTA